MVEMKHIKGTCGPVTSLLLFLGEPIWRLMMLLRTKCMKTCTRSGNWTGIKPLLWSTIINLQVKLLHNCFLLSKAQIFQKQAASLRSSSQTPELHPGETFLDQSFWRSLVGRGEDKEDLVNKACSGVQWRNVNIRAVINIHQVWRKWR